MHLPAICHGSIISNHYDLPIRSINSCANTTTSIMLDLRSALSGDFSDLSRTCSHITSGKFPITPFRGVLGFWAIPVPTSYNQKWRSKHSVEKHLVRLRAFSICQVKYCMILHWHSRDVSCRNLHLHRTHLHLMSEMTLIHSNTHKVYSVPSSWNDALGPSNREGQLGGVLSLTVPRLHIDSTSRRAYKFKSTRSCFYYLKRNETRTTV